MKHLLFLPTRSLQNSFHGEIVLYMSSIGICSESDQTVKELRLTLLSQ